jgi:hypothetical protein
VCACVCVCECLSKRTEYAAIYVKRYLRLHQEPLAPYKRSHSSIGASFCITFTVPKLEAKHCEVVPI